MEGHWKSVKIHPARFRHVQHSSVEMHHHDDRQHLLSPRQTAVDFARGSKHVAEQTLLLSRLAVKLLGYLGLGYKWISKLLRLILFSMLLLPGFAQVGVFYIFSGRVIKSVVYGKYPRNRLDIYLPHPLGVETAPTTRHPRRSLNYDHARSGSSCPHCDPKDFSNTEKFFFSHINGDSAANGLSDANGFQCPSCGLYTNNGLGVPAPVPSGRANLDRRAPAQGLDVSSLLESIGGGEALPLLLSPRMCCGKEGGAAALHSSQAGDASSGCQGCEADGVSCCRGDSCTRIQGRAASYCGAVEKGIKGGDLAQDGSVTSQASDPGSGAHCVCPKLGDSKERQRGPGCIPCFETSIGTSNSVDHGCGQKCGKLCAGGSTAAILRRSASAHGHAEVNGDAIHAANCSNDICNPNGNGPVGYTGDEAANSGGSSSIGGSASLRSPASLLRALSWPSLRLPSWLGKGGSGTTDAGDSSPCSSDNSMSSGGKARGPRERPLAPVVVYITGGAWIIGYKAWGALLGQRLARRGVLAVCLDYRNFPQGVASDMVTDITQGIGWVLQNIRLYGGDPNRVLVVGQSAGAHLSACVLFNQAVRDAATAATAPSPTVDVNAPCSCPAVNGFCAAQVPRSSGCCHSPTGKAPGCGYGDVASAPGGCSTSEASPTSCYLNVDRARGGEASMSHAASGNQMGTTVRMPIKGALPGTAEDGGQGTDVNSASEIVCGDDAVVGGGSKDSRVGPGTAACVADASCGTCDAWSPVDLMGWVGVSGGYDMEELVEHFHQRGLYRSIFRSIMEESLAKYSPTQTCRLPHFRAAAASRLPPILLLHGMADHSIPYASSVAFATAIKETGLTDVRLKLLAGKSHTDFILSDPFRGQQDTLMEELLGTLWGEESTLAVIRRFGRGPQTVPSFLVDVARKVCPF